jgi:hypothetical protein
MVALLRKNLLIQADLAFLLTTVPRSFVSTFDSYNIGIKCGTIIRQKCFVSVLLQFCEYLESLNVKSGVGDRLSIEHLVCHLTTFAYLPNPELLSAAAIREEVKSILIYGLQDYTISMYAALLPVPDQGVLYYIGFCGLRISYGGATYIPVRLEMSGNVLLSYRTELFSWHKDFFNDVVKFAGETSLF